MRPNKNVLELRLTADGSHTLYNSLLDEHYHSQHGSIQESKHVFIEKGLGHMAKDADSLNILEVGFGTGLNALLTILHEERPEVKYVGLEPFPVGLELLNGLNYIGQLGLQENNVFQKLHDALWGQWVDFANRFSLLKLEENVQDFESNEKFHLVYFDAFAPRPQEEMWYTEVFDKVYSLLKKGGCLVTYCAKGQVRRNMQAAGFQVERLDGPPGKREMLRATRNG